MMFRFKSPLFVRSLCAVTALTALPLLTADEASAEEYVMTFQTVAPDGTPWAKQLQRIKKRWEAESGGRLKVKVILGRGNEKALVRKCKAGDLQAIGVSTGAMADEVPEMGVFELPFLFNNHAQADKVIDNHLFKPVEKLLGDNGFQLYIFSENGFRNFATKGKVIKTPADLATLKMRAQENWIHEAMYNSLGGNPVKISVAEVLTSLSTGQVQGFDNTPLFAFAASWYTKIDTWIVSNHIYQPAVIVLNKGWYDKLPEDLQKLVLSKRRTETNKGRDAIRKIGPALLKTMASKGITVYEMTDAEKAVFRDKTRPIYKTFRKKVGAKGAKILDIILKNI